MQGKDSGYSELVILVLEDNTIGCTFYEKHHYTRDGATKIFQRFNKKEVRFVKKIN